MAGEELRPLSVGEIMNEAVRVYVSRFGTLFRLAAVFILPFEAIYAFTTGTTTSTRSDASLFSGLLIVLTAQLASAACLKAVSDSYLGHPTSWRSSFDFVWHRVGPVLGVAVIDAVLVGIGFFLLVIPGLYLDIAFLVATPALLIEGLSPVRALRRSRDLVRGYWWRSFGCFLLAALFAGLISLIPTLLFLHATGKTASSSSPSLAGQLLSVGLSLFTTPFMAAVVVLLYYDLRVRKEGFGREDLARSVNIDPSLLGPGRADPPFPDR